MKHILIFIISLTYISCGQFLSEKNTMNSSEDKFAVFIEKAKFVEERFYTGLANEKLRPVFEEAINLAAIDFQTISELENPSNEKYLEQIKIGLARFSEHEINIDTEDRERICTYFEEIMDLVGLKSSNGQLNNFMYGFTIN